MKRRLRPRQPFTIHHSPFTIHQSHMSDTKRLPVACDLTVFGDNERRRQRAVLEEFRTKVRAVEELPDGYSFRLAPEPYMLQLIAELISFESRCCGFLDFRLEVLRGGSSVTLSLTGGEGAKDFLREELHLSDARPA